VLTGLALGVPIAASVYWIVNSLPPALSGGANVSMLNAAAHTAMYAAAAAAIATVAATPVALLATRFPGKMTRILERSTYLVLAIPGVVIAFALYYFTERYAGALLNHTGAGTTAALLVVAYAIMFFPLALVGVRASLARAPASFEEIARSLGKGRLAATLSTTLRLAVPGLAAAFCLVFLSAVTELTATLLLIPAGTQTLATQFWKYEQSLSYSQAAPFALVMIVVAALPSVVLSRRGRIGA
jgi:iron(III) transport system permease protein